MWLESAKGAEGGGGDGIFFEARDPLSQRMRTNAVSR